MELLDHTSHVVGQLLDTEKSTKGLLVKIVDQSVVSNLRIHQGSPFQCLVLSGADPQDITGDFPELIQLRLVNVVPRLTQRILKTATNLKKFSLPLSDGQHVDPEETGKVVERMLSCKSLEYIEFGIGGQYQTDGA